MLKAVVGELHLRLLAQHDGRAGLARSEQDRIEYVEKCDFEPLHRKHCKYNQYDRVNVNTPVRLLYAACLCVARQWPDDDLHTVALDSRDITHHDIISMS